MPLEKPACYDAIPLCFCANCLRYDLRHVTESSSSLSSRPSCTVAESTSGLTAVCPVSQSVPPVVSPAQLSSSVSVTYVTVC